MDGLVNLGALYSARRFSIPDYQRSYSWESRQWQDLIDDLEVLRDGKDHFTGMVVLHLDADDVLLDQGGAEHKRAEIVDGQQRLTTLTLLLDAVRRGARSLGQDALADGIETRFLWLLDAAGQQRPKLSFADGSDAYFRARVLDEAPGPHPAATPAEQRLLDATTFFRSYVTNKLQAEGEGAATWLLGLHNKISHRLMFNPFYVTDLAEVGVIFEVMNDRGRPLSTMDLVKNYVLYLGQQGDFEDGLLHSDVMETWKLIFNRLMQAGLGSGDEDQLLRSHWRMAYDYTPRNWKGSQSFKGRFNLRRYENHDAALLSDLRAYVRTLGDASTAFGDIYAPQRANSFGTFNREDRIAVIRMSDCLLRVDVVAVFQPLLLGARLSDPENGSGYLRLVQACERYAFRVNRLKGARADAGRSRLFQLGYLLYHESIDIDQAALAVDETSLRYCSQSDFASAFALDDETSDWYDWGGLRYFLYEYERHRTGNEDLAITWAELHAVDRPKTIEHILPQTPTTEWLKAFTPEERAHLTHDLGNLCLTQDNSSYSNKPFEQKRGYAGAEGRCYANASLQMERDLATFDTWTAAELLQRREAMVSWALERWGLPRQTHGGPPAEDLALDEEAFAG